MRGSIMLAYKLKRKIMNLLSCAACISNAVLSATEGFWRLHRIDAENGNSDALSHIVYALEKFSKNPKILSYGLSLAFRWLPLNWRNLNSRNHSSRKINSRKSQLAEFLTHGISTRGNS